mgnify:CR=1 FL=1
MDDGRSRQLWDHTASLMALMANLQRVRRTQKVIAPADFHPHMRKADRGWDLASESGREKFRQSFGEGVKVTVYKASDMPQTTKERT